MADGDARAFRRRWSEPVRVAVVTALSVGLALAICIVACALHFFLGWPSSPPPQLTIIGDNCGTAYQNAVNGQTYDPDNGELCLWRAYIRCHTSTLIAVYNGVDVGHTDAITVQPNGGRCAVTDTWQAYGEGLGGCRTTGAVSQCAGLVQGPSGELLVKSCESPGDLTLWPRPPQQVGHVCGILYTAGPSAVSSQTPAVVSPPSVTTVEDCFWQASRSCAGPASLVVDQAIPYTSAGTPAAYSFADHTLVVQPSHGTCALTDAVGLWPSSSGVFPPPLVTYTCASLSREADGGLTAQGCGTEGAVIIPSAAAA